MGLPPIDALPCVGENAGGLHVGPRWRFAVNAVNLPLERWGCRLDADLTFRECVAW